MTDDGVEFTGPVFKRLTKTDAGKGESHTGGPTLTKPIRGYFPIPTVGVPPKTAVEVILVKDDSSGILFVATKTATVQIQGQGEKTPETYLSDIQILRKDMQKGDLMLVEPAIENGRLFRITLVKQSSPRFASINAQTFGKEAGVLRAAIEPPSDKMLREADEEIAQQSAKPFELFDIGASFLPTGKRIARSRAFFRQVMAAYDNKCAFCGAAGRLGDGRTELEAAHIVSRSKFGADDVRNGLALCRVHHWAFDRGAVRVNALLVIEVAPDFSALPENHIIAAVDGKALSLPKTPVKMPDHSALQWHRDEIASEW